MAGLDSTEKQLQRIETEVEGLVSKLTRLSDVTAKTVLVTNEYGITSAESANSFSKELTKAEALMLKIQDMHFSGNIDESSVKQLLADYETLNNSTLQLKINEAAAADELKSYMEYAGQLKSYLNSVIKLLGQATSESKHLGEYIEFNSDSIKPYGINTRKATDEDKKLLDNAERVTVGGNVFEINTEQLRQIGPEYEAAVREFISFLTQFKALNKELSATGGVNNISGRRFLSNTGEIRPEYQGVLAIGNNNDLNDDREYTKGVDVAKVSYKEDGKLIERIVKQIAVTPGLKGEDGLNLGLYAQSNSNRLEGFTDEQGEHLGYKQLVSGLENVIEKVIASLGKLANFAPGLMSENTRSGFNPILSEGVGYSSTDIAKRMSFGDIIDGDNETGVETVKDVGITLVKSFDELGQSSSEVKGKLENLGSVLPATTSDVRTSSDGLDYLANRRIGDKDITDSFGNTTSSTEYLDANAEYEAVRFSADIRENMTESQKKAAEMIADLKNGISKEITKSGMMTSLVNDDEQRTLQQYSFSSNYRGSKKNKGAVDYWGQAKSEIEKLDARISNNSVNSTDITRQLTLVMDTFKKGGVEALAKPESEFSDKTSLQILNDMLADLMKEVNAFDKGSYAESASKPDKDGKVLFDKQKYLDFVTSVNTKLQSIINDDKFKEYGTDTSQLDEISNRADEVQKVVQNTRNAETNKKLDSEYLKNMMQEHFLSKEIAGREANISSGLLAGSDLENAIKRVEQLNNDLQSTRDNINQIVSEGESLGKSFDTTNERANTLKSLYDDIARSLGSTAEADKFFSQVKGLSSLNYDSLTGVVSSFGDKLSHISIDTLLEQLKLVKNDLGLMSGGTYERALNSSIISSKGLSKSEQEVAAYQNNATREQLYNARVAMTDSFNVPEDFKKNIKVDDLNQGIEKIKKSFTDTSKKIEEISAGDTTGALANQIINFRDKLGKLETDFTILSQGLSDSSSIGELRAVFERSRYLANSLNTLQSQVDLAANTAKQNQASDRDKLANEMYQAKFNEVKNHVGNQEAITGKKMPLQAQLEYYKSAIKQFEQGSAEYLTILKLQRDVEQSILAQEAYIREQALQDEYRQVEASIKAAEDEAKRKQEALNKQLDAIKRYVSDQNAVRLSQGKSVMTSQEEADYYASQLPKFAEGTREYIEILKLKNQAEAKAANETQAKAAEQARAQQEAIKSLMEETKNYVSTQEALSGQKMSFSDQASYYDQQANKMKQLAGESKEYIEILKLKRQAETKAAEEAQKAAEIEKKAQEDAVKAARDRVNNTLGTIKKLADGVNSAVNKIVSIIRTGISLINKVFSTIGNFVGKITKGAKAIISLFGSLSNRVRGTAGDSNRLNGSFNILKGTATELRSKIMLLKGAFDTLFNNQMINKAENLMASVYSLKNIAGGGVTKEVLDWANSMEYAFGISAKELIGDINELTGVLYGLGMTAEDTAVGSENLLMMSRYLAFMGAAGGDAKTVMTKLVSGMKGMTQAIDDLGLSVRDAQMDSFLESLKAQGGEFANITTDFSSLNEEARVYVRYAALINQFTKNYDITNFAKALDTVTGRMQIMKQTAASLVTTLGTGLVKAISKLAIFIVPLLKAIESAVSKVFAFFGIDVSMTTDINEGTDAVDDLNDGLDKTKGNLDEIDKKSKKAKGSLQSFDRVNNVASSNGSDSGSESGSGFDYHKLMTSMLDDLNKLADETAQSFADKMQEKMMIALKNMRDKFLQFAKDITGRVNFDLEFDWPKIKQSLVDIKDNIISLIKSWGTFSIEIALKIADDANIGKIITKITEFISAVTDLAVAFSGVLIPVLRNFYDEVLSPIVKLVGEKVANAFDKATGKVKGWTKYLKDNKPELIDEWTEKLKHFFNIVTGKESANPEDGVLGTVLEVLNKVGKVIEALTPIVLELASAFGTFLKEEFLPWLNEKLDDLAEWLSENKDDIVEFLKEIGGFAWDSFKVFVDLIGKLVDFCVKHPTEVKAFLAGLAAIKIASWATSTAAGIGQLVFQLQLLSKLKGVTKILGGLGTATTGTAVATAATGTAATGAAATGAELATIGAATGTAAKTSVLSKILGTTGTLASVETADGATLSSYMMGGSGVLGGLAKFGTLMGSGATTAGGMAAAGASSIAGIVGGIAGIGSGIKDLYDASKETNEEIKEQKNWSGGTKIGMVGAGAAAGAAIGSVVPGIGTAVGAAVGAGVGGVSAIFKGSDISEWLHDAWDNTLKPFFTETIPENFGKLVDGIGEFFTETVPETIGSIGEGIGTFFTETVPEFFGNLVDGVVQFFTEDVPYALGNIAGNIEIFFTETVPGFFSGLWEDIKTFFTETIPNAAETIKENVTTFFTETVPNFFKDLWENIETFFTETIPNAAETIKEKATTFFTETVPGFFKDLWSKVETFFTETVPNTAETIKTKAKTFFTETVPGFFKDLWSKVKEFFTETVPEAVEKVKKSIKKFFTKTIPSKIKSLLGGIGDIFGGAIDWIKEKFSSIGSSFSAGYDDAVNKTSANTAKTVTSHAVGGSIAGGQLFIANENGQPELIGNIDSSPKTNVANNNMIIEAMTDGVFTGVYNALAEVSNQRSNVGGTGQNINLKIDGFGLIDSSTLSELARMLAPYNNSNSTNIADVGFSI